MSTANKNPTISIIVPVYKVEPYIHQCIDSILGQTFSDFELILVDDGSPDNCGAICDDYASNDSRIVVIHQKNGGLSAARNTALEIIRGEYVAFIDSDDYISSTYLEVLYSAIAESDADLSMCGFYWADEDHLDNPEKYICTEVSTTLSGRDLSFLRYTKKIDIAVWAKLFSRHLFSQLRFPVGKVFEDQATVPYIFYGVNKACLIDSCHYYYRVRRTSISHSAFSSNRFDNILHMNGFISFLERKQEKELAELAKTHRENTLALYIILAKHHKIPIPNGCRMNEFKALSILRKNYPNDKYSWFLSLVHPKGVFFHQYYRKLESIITGKPL